MRIRLVCQFPLHQRELLVRQAVMLPWRYGNPCLRNAVLDSFENIPVLLDDGDPVDALVAGRRDGSYTERPTRLQSEVRNVI